MSTDPSDATASTSQPHLLTPPSPAPPTTPPFADAVVRPFTSQGSVYALPPSERPSTEHGSPIDPASAKFCPYGTASARTSYTRVDVDSLPGPEYPPLPPLPTAFAVQHFSAAVDAATLLATTTTATTNGAQPHVTEPPIPQTPHVSLTFLLVSGHRKTQSFEPETTVGRVKELVWNAWPARDADWQDERPPAPSYLRILYLGKILQDDDTLLRVGFPTLLPSTPNATPTIVHLSIRHYALPSDDPALSKKKRLSVAISRRLSSAGVPGREIEQETEGEPRRASCCTGCTIC